MKRTWPAANIWKHFLILFTGRRNFIPLLSIYFLTLPDTNAQQIGMYSAVWYLIWLIFQIPAGYRWDKRGNKTTIIISKICLVASSIAFIIGGNFRFFLIGSMLSALGGDAFATGNNAAFLHDSLATIGKEDQFKRISSSMKWWVSFLSIFFIIALPFFTQINMKLPFIIWLWIDIIGLIVACTLFPTKAKDHNTNNISIKNIINTIKLTKNTGFYSIGLFSAIIGAFLMADNAYRTPYLQSLGYPIIFIGLVMWGSRLVRFIVGQYAHKIENIISFKKLMFIEIVIFCTYYLSTAYISNPYVVWGIFSLIVGYFRWRSDIYTDHLIRLMPEKKYKSTMLSLRWWVSGVIQSILTFGIGFVMTGSYKVWFFLMGILLAIMLSINYIFFIKETKNSKINF